MTENPQVQLSIIIPALNEGAVLEYTLRLLKLHLPDDMPYEIIVGDHGSTDNTVDIALAHGAALVDCSAGRNVATVRNNCSAAAQGLTLLFLDADIAVTKEWGENLLYAILVAGQGGIVGSKPEIYYSNFFTDNWFMDLNPAYLGGAHMLMARNTFIALNGFDENKDTGEDVDFCYRARESGLTITHNPHLLVFHRRYPDTLSKFFKREVWHGMGDWSSIIPQSLNAAVSAVFSLSLLLTPFFPILLMLAVALACGVTYYKFPVAKMSSYPHKFFLTGTYMVARFISMFYQFRHKRIFSWQNS